MTDESKLYPVIGREFADHQTVNHSAGEYSPDGAHVNTVEGFFSQLKRSIDGTHHHVSERHLHRYVSEFNFRYNRRKIADGPRTEQAIRQAAGKRLMYRETVVTPTSEPVEAPVQAKLSKLLSSYELSHTVAPYGRLHQVTDVWNP
jgi:hypothetical protein